MDIKIVYKNSSIYYKINIETTITDLHRFIQKKIIPFHPSKNVTSKSNYNIFMASTESN